MTPLEEEPFSDERRARKLTHYDQFQCFAALRERSERGALKWSPETVARAFGVSRWTILQLNRCLTSVSEPRRYRTVKEEYEARGHGQFMAKYYTPDLIDRLIIARRETPKRTLK